MFFSLNGNITDLPKRCDEISYKSSDFLILDNNTMKLPPKCIQDKIFLNSTGYKYCMLRDPGSENSMLECKKPESGLRLPTYIAPIKQLIRYKGAFRFYPSS